MKKFMFIIITVLEMKLSIRIFAYKISKDF